MPHSFSKSLATCCACLSLWGCGGGQGEVSSDLETLQGRRVINKNTTALSVAARQQATPASQQAVAVPAPPAVSALPVVNTSTPSPVAVVSTAPTPPAVAAAAATVGAVVTSPVTQTPAATPSLPQSSVASTCGADIGGWTTPIPSPLDSKVALRDLKQPGSRLLYISSSAGSDQTGAIYFWNGSAIVDDTGKAANSAGVAYGSDPVNPSAAVKPYKRWAFVGPRSNGGDIGSKGTVGFARPTTRAGFPDWWLFKRGDTFDVQADLLSFERESNPTATTVNSSLAVPGGRSATERQIVGAYGDVCSPRPRFINPLIGFLSRIDLAPAPAFKNVAYLSLHFDGRDRNPGTYPLGISLIGHSAESKNILFEDMLVVGVPSSIQGSSAQVTFRRSIIADAYETSGGHVQGLYYYGNRDSVLRIEESIFLRNGFKQNPAVAAWPPTGDQIWSVYSRNLYLAGELQNMQSTIVDTVSMLGASGDQIRNGMVVERNFFYQGYVHMGAHGGYTNADGATGTMKDNVLQRFVGTGTNDNRGHPGGGLILGSGAHGVEVSGNIVTNAQHAALWFGLELNALAWECSGFVFNTATRANRVFGNVFDSGGAEAAVRMRDGVPDPTSASCVAVPTFPGVTGNDVSQNVLINSKSKMSNYVTEGKTAAGTSSDTTYSANKLYGSRAEAARALGWRDPDRTLKTYLISKGVSVSSADGLPEYYQRAIAMRRGSWSADWTSKSLVNYMRDGVSMAALN